MAERSECDKWLDTRPYRSASQHECFNAGFAAGQAAERKRIDDAPRAWVGQHEGGEEVIEWTKDDAMEKLCEISEHWDDGPSAEFGVHEVALVPLSPTPQQESEA